MLEECDGHDVVMNAAPNMPKHRKQYSHKHHYSVLH